MAKVMPSVRHSKAASEEEQNSSKASTEYRKIVGSNPSKRANIMFQDEAGFGRINKPKACWCAKGIRPFGPCHQKREYRYAYGAVNPRDGSSFSLVIPYCTTDCMNVFLQELSKSHADDEILLVCDGAMWHKSNGLMIPANIHITHIPPYAPEMNPAEQVWKEIRKRGCRNEIFKTLVHVVDRLCGASKICRKMSFRA